MAKCNEVEVKGVVTDVLSVTAYRQSRYGKVEIYIEHSLESFSDFSDV